MLLFYLPAGYVLMLTVWLAFLGGSVWWGLRARRRYRGNPSRLRLIHAGLSLWFVAVALTLPELWFAVAYDRTDSFNMTNVSVRWFKRHVQLNPQGFRDAKPLTRVARSGAKRIVFLGDSFTFGHGLENIANRFSDRVGQALERQQPGRFQVANLGVPGIAVNDMASIWDHAIVQPDCQADIAIYSICLNDIEWMSRKETEQQYKPLQVLKPQFFFLRDTYFYNWLYFRIQLLRQPKLLNYYDYVRQYYAGPPWKSMERELDNLHEKVKQQGAELRLVVFPFLHNLGPDYPFKAAHQRILDYARDRQIKVLDLEPVLSPHAKEGLTVNPFDAHPNARAHEYTAEAIVRDLLSDLFQPLDQNPRKL